MEQFVVKKNTLPYVHQWAVIDTKTGDKVGEYKTKQTAIWACWDFEKNGLPDNNSTPSRSKTVWDAASERMKRPGGNILPKSPPEKPKYSDKRRVELN